MKRAILSRLQPFLAWPRGRSEAAIKGQVTMNGASQWDCIWHGEFGGMQLPAGGLRGMQVPGGSSQPQVGLQGLGDAEPPPGMGMVQPCSASQSPRDGRRTSGCTPGLRGTSRVLQPFGGGHGGAATQEGRRGWCRGRCGERVWLQPRDVGYTHTFTTSL